MLAASALFLVSAIGSGVPFGIPDFIVWRVIGGVGIGVASIIAPIYIAETAPAHLRGRLGSMQQFAIVIGIFVALLSKKGDAPKESPHNISIPQNLKKLIPDDIDYDLVSSLRLEARQKLKLFKPRSVGQASRISGVTPADVSVLLIYLASIGR